MGLLNYAFNKALSDNKTWKRLSPKEKDWIEDNPYKAYKISQITQRAFIVTAQEFPGDPAHNDDADAFRHCFWSASLVREVGYDAAKEFTDLHESDPNLPQNECKMDLANNKVGLEIGRVQQGLEAWLIKECHRALDSGKLQVRP